MKLLAPAVVIAAMTGMLIELVVHATAAPGQSPAAATWPAPLDEGHHLFYSGRYEEAAAIALDIRINDVVNLEASELRTSALHFQIRRALGNPKDRGTVRDLPGTDARVPGGVRSRAGRGTRGG